MMEYLEGVTLRDHLEKNGRMKTDKALIMLKPVMLALQSIHRDGLIHRDVSPDNIMVLPDGTVKLMDFGSARDFEDSKRSLSVMLKPGYAPV